VAVSEHGPRSLRAAAWVALLALPAPCQGGLGVQAGALRPTRSLTLDRVGRPPSSVACVRRWRGGARRRARARAPWAACQRFAPRRYGVSEGYARRAGAALAAGPADADAAGAAHGGLQHAAGACHAHL